MKVKQKTEGRDRRNDIWIVMAVMMTALAAIRYFHILSGDYFTFIDEYQTFDTAVGFFQTGKFNVWDFHTQTLTDMEYSRAWPHTVLLCAWFHVFGVGVPAGKALSAMLGIIFILSVFYITWKIYRNYAVTILSCLFLLSNPSVTTVFRQIRMYSLWMPLMVWFLYFVFLALEKRGNYSLQNKASAFLHKNFDYSWKYIIGAAVFLVFGCATHINTLISGAGILLFFLYLLLTKQERKYKVVFVVMLAAGVLLGALFFIASRGIRLPVVFDLYLVLASDEFFGARNPKSIRYYDWVRDFMGSPWLMGAACVCLAAAFFRNRRKRDEKFDFSLFSFLISASSLYCFVYVFSRYYQDRYMIYIAPFLSIAAAWGITEAFSIGKRKGLQAAAVGIFVLGTVYQIKSGYAETYYNDDICYHRQVYERIRQDAGETPAAIAGYDFRDYYGVQILDEYVTAEFDRVHDMEILCEFAREYPQGYVAVETDKIYGITEPVRIFMQNHSERIAGDGIDEWNIDVSRYRFLYPGEERKGMFPDTGWQSGCVEFSFETKGQETEIRIGLDTGQMSPGAKILFLDFGIFTEAKESLPLCYQLVIPQDGQGGVYEYTTVFDKPCLAVELRDDCEVYYADESYREIKLWEK